MENFTINGKTYEAKDVDFYFLVVLNKAKIDMMDIMGMAAANCYFAYCSGLSEEDAAAEISQHVINNKGDFGDLVSVYGSKVNESDFFRALMGRTQNEEPETESSPVTEETTKKRTKKPASN